MDNIIKNRYLHLVLAILLLGGLCFLPSLSENSKVDVHEFNVQLNKKEVLAEKTLDDIVSNHNPKGLLLFSDKFVALNRAQGITFFVIQNKERIFWTDRSIPFSNELYEFNSQRGIAKLKNGWYQYIIKEKNKKKYLALILVKHTSEIKNKYFKNRFHKSFDVHPSMQVILEKNDKAINDAKGQHLFSLVEGQSQETNPSNNWIGLIAFFVGFLLLISFVSKQTRKMAVLRNYSAIIVIGVIFLSRVLLLYYDIFFSIFEMELFSPTVFAQSIILPSLGQLLISSVFFSLIVYYFSKFIIRLNPNKKSLLLFFGLVISFLPLVMADLIKGLITNSKINFDINYLLDLNAYSFIGIGSVVLLLITLILFVKLVFNHFFDKAFKRNHVVSICWLFSLITVLIGHFFLDISYFLTGWILPVILLFSFKTTSKSSFYRSALLIFVIALTVSYAFIHLSKGKEQINKEFIAKKIAKERDPVAEFLFNEVEEKIITDTLVREQLVHYWDVKPIIDEHIANRYFGGYWTKYDVNIITVCHEADTILIEPDNINVNCLTFFEDKIEQESETYFDERESLNFLYSDEGISSYLAKVKINKDSVDYYMFIEFLPKIFSKAEGYPELLLDEKNTFSSINTNQYSFAKYKKGKLIDHLGKFNYSIEIDGKFRFNTDGFYKTTFDDAYHVIYQSDKNTTIILSSPQKTMFNYITTFSYFFIITCFIALMLGFFYKVSPFNWQLALSDFSTKIQLFIIVSIFMSFILFGWATTYYIKKQNHDKNKTLLAEKVQSVLIELEHKLGDKSELNLSIYDEMTYYLVKFSNVFYTDINLYDLDGRLLASSRPEIFDKGLIGDYMNTEAYKAIHMIKKSNFTHNENIGELNYLSTYVPFRNEKNEILAYMNLPYFAKQKELENELSSFYTALVNVYGLLFLITAIIAVFFANYISEPVRLIKNKISALQLGKSSELLEWQSNDEIGALVLEYNKKVLELEKSAQLLVQSERESAWREMAKQVAHEIKNPLTPMKLSIQQLERLAKDESEDLTERIERTAKTLIEQIDSLTKIANEFSNFAKMPKASEEEIDLVPIIETAIDLYHEEKPIISLIDNSEGKASLLADKDQISRVFNNLIKNAIQAIPDYKDGEIIIEVKKQEDSILVAVQDNGIGIPNDKKDKIFVPNFTTKSTGMGLGLAMVKNIIENAHGSIWFETKEDEGTTFFIKFLD
jgi:signal transduction histidine kinase